MKRIEFTIKEKNPKKVTAIVRIFSGQTIGDMKEQKTFMATNEQGTFALTPVNTSFYKLTTKACVEITTCLFGQKYRRVYDN